MVVLRPIFNRPEQITYARLREVCTRHSACVYTKIRVADLLTIAGSGLPETLFEFALQSHFDFVVTDAAHVPLFAVEFDGPSHLDPLQVERDRKKDELSRRFGLPLHRVRSTDLFRTETQLDRLTELVERWFDRHASGRISRDPQAPPQLPPSSLRDPTVVSEIPSCPICGARMVPKDGKYGRFLSCERFPACQGSSDLPAPGQGLASAKPRESAVKPARPTPVKAVAPSWLIPATVLGLAVLATAVVVSRSYNAPAASDPGGRTDADVGYPVPAGATAPESATVRQRNLLNLLIDRRGWDGKRRDREVRAVLGYERALPELTKAEATKLITQWDDRRP